MVEQQLLHGDPTLADSVEAAKLRCADPDLPRATARDEFCGVIIEDQRLQQWKCVEIGILVSIVNQSELDRRWRFKAWNNVVSMRSWEMLDLDEPVDGTEVKRVMIRVDERDDASDPILRPVLHVSFDPNRPQHWKLFEIHHRRV